MINEIGKRWWENKENVSKWTYCKVLNRIREYVLTENVYYKTFPYIDNISRNKNYFYYNILDKTLYDLKNKESAYYGTNPNSKQFEELVWRNINENNDLRNITEDVMKYHKKTIASR